MGAGVHGGNFVASGAKVNQHWRDNGHADVGGALSSPGPSPHPSFGATRRVEPGISGFRVRFARWNDQTGPC